MFFNSIKEINRWRTEINILFSKGMSNIFLKVSVEKKWQTQNFSIMDLKSLSLGQFLRAQLTQISFNLKFFCCNLKIRGLGTKLYVAFLLY